MQSTHDISYSTTQITARGQTFELLNCALARHLIATQQAGLALHSDKNGKFCCLLPVGRMIMSEVKSIMISGTSHLLVLISVDGVYRFVFVLP